MLFIFGMFYLGFFAFPYPDMPPEKKIHTSVSMWCVLGGAVLMHVSIAGGIIKALDRRLVSSLSKVSGGSVFLIAGWLYGAYFALPLPNPPPEGMLWVAHVSVSITLLLTGLGFLLLVAFRKMSAKRALHWKSR